MKKILAGMFGCLAIAAFLSACGPDMKTIQDATNRATSDQTKAEADATTAEHSAADAEAAAKKASDEASGAEDSARAANDAASRLEAAFATSVTK